MRLALHIGHGKTGSSALQSWLARHSEALLVQGIAYPLCSPVSGHTEREAAQGRFSMGNGFVFEELLATGRLGDQAWIPPQAHTLVFSCERWTRQWRQRWPEIQCSAAAAGFQTDVLLLVRDPLDHAHSLYRQMVKAHGYAADLDTWMSEYELPEVVLEVLEALERLSLPCAIHNYSRCASELLSPLAAWLALPQPWLHQHPLALQRVNAAPAALVGRTSSHEAQRAMLLRLWPVLESLNLRLPPEARLHYPTPVC